MANPNRTFIPGAPHHIVTRGNNQRTLFSYPHERETFLFQLGRAKKYAPCEVHAIALLTNHVHLVVTPPDDLSLPRFMKHALQCYAQKRNKRRDTTGCLFEHRYDCFPIEDEAYLANVLAYVDLNPAADGEAATPEGSKWSTYGLHVPSPACRIPRGLWTPSQWYLSLGVTDEERAARYAEWVRDFRERRELAAELQKIDTDDALVALGKNRRVRRPDQHRAR